MKAVAITGLNKSEVIEVKKPIPKANEILVKIKSSAICTFEQRIFFGEKKIQLPFVGGHEVSGIIEELGTDVDTNKFKIGDRVAVDTHSYCGSCYNCRHGRTDLCPHISDRYFDVEHELYNGLAEYITMPQENIYVFDNDNISYDEMSLTEPVACVTNSISKLNIEFGDDALVVGGGIMGQLHLMLLTKRGVRTILSEPNEERRKFALEHGYCNIAIDPTKVDLKQEIMKITRNVGCQAVINTTAIGAIEKQCLGLLSDRGVLVTYSSQHPDTPIEVSPGWLHSNQPILTGTVNPSAISFSQAAEVINKEIINIKDLVSKTYEKEDCNEAFTAAMSPTTYRVIIRF